MDELFKCLFAKHWLLKGALGALPNEAPSKLYRRAFTVAREALVGVFDSGTEIELDPVAIEYVDRQLSSLDFENERADIFSEVYEVFGGTGVKASEGQFFTPRVAVDLLIDIVDPSPGSLVCDPACGAGGFLAGMAKRWLSKGTSTKVVLESLFGCDKDSYLVRLTTGQLALLLDKLPNVVCGDSLAQITPSGQPFTFPACDFVLTNPPFGSKIVAADSTTLDKFQLARIWRKSGDDSYHKVSEMTSAAPPQILFLELCLMLLKPGGTLGAILPESLVSSRSYGYVVQHLKRSADIRAVVGMPESLFKTSGKGGTHTKTVALIAQKHPVKRPSKAVFFAEAKWCGHDSRARVVPNNDLPAIARNFRLFASGKDLNGGGLGTIVPVAKVQLNLAPRAFEFDTEAGAEKLSKKHDLRKFGDLVEKGFIKISTGDEVGKLAYGTGDIPFIRTSDISTWEIKADPKHRVSSEIHEKYGRKQDVRAEDIFMVRDGTYLIGTCAIVESSDLPLLYQSHIYKIRVADSKHFDPYLLLASLSCPFVQKQIKSYCVSQDIIDSLGTKINDIVLPFPKSAKKCADISRRVKEALQARAKSKELAREAMLEVVED
jgi:type I restriction enzyme M protein